MLQTRPRLRRDRRLGRRDYYFAYGSNLHPAWIVARLGSVRVVSIARLADHRLAFHKRGRDGSGKCDIVRAPGFSVLGIVYQLARHAMLQLDRIEGRGYRRLRLPVAMLPGDRLLYAWTYRARQVAVDVTLVPADWYLGLVTTGARLHRLPDDYADDLASTAIFADTHWLRRRQVNALTKSRLRRTRIRGIVNSVTSRSR